MGVFGFLVDADELAVLHQKLAVGNGRAAELAGHAEKDVAIDILIRKRSVRLVIHDDDIGGGAGLEHAQLVREILCADLRVVLKQHTGHFAPRDVRQAGVQALDAERGLERFDHIVCPCVGAEAEQDARLGQRQHRADADGVGHVGLGVVDDHGVGVLDELDLRGVHVDAVAEDGLLAQNAVVVQALHGAAAVVLQGVIDVVHALGDVDVVAGAAVVGLDHAVKRLVGDGEQRVAAEHGGEHRILLLLAVGDPVGVLLDGLQALLLAVAVGDLVAQTGADAEFLGALADLEQGAGDLAVGRVMVENGRNALLDAVDVQGICGGAGAFERQLAVHGPPRTVEDLIEVRGIVADDGQAACQRGIDVGMRVDECGHDDAALGVDDLGLRVFCAQRGFFADLDDFGAFIGDGAFFVIALAALVAGDDASVCE